MADAEFAVRSGGKIGLMTMTGCVQIAKKKQKVTRTISSRITTGDMMQAATALTIRWMIKPDLPNVIALQANVPHPWSVEEFVEMMKRSNVVAIVAERGDIIEAVAIYELHKRYIRIMYLVGGTEGLVALIDKLKRKLHEQRREKLVCLVLETSLWAQKFLASQDFLATEVIRGGFGGLDEYRFVYIREGGL